MIDFNPSEVPHNVMRFDIELGHIFELIEGGELDPRSLVNGVRKAIIEAVNKETRWRHEDSEVICDDLNGINGSFYYESIGYDFS